MELHESPVCFDREAHAYYLPDGTPLSGITAMLSRQLFPGKYRGVPASVLDRAAQKGSLVHESIELMDDLGVRPSLPEAAHYEHLLKQSALRYEASEYLVSDCAHFASCIDKVFRDDDTTFSLADIKTTYELDKEYVRWQLSIYAYLFEQQNPGASVRHLYAVWLRPDRGELTEVERVPETEVLRLLLCEVDGKQYVPACPVASSSEALLPERYAAMEERMAEIAAQYKYWSEQRRQLTDGIREAMAEAGVKKWIGDKVSFTLKGETEREEFDTKRFRAEHPELYSQYLTKKRISKSVLFNIR